MIKNDQEGFTEILKKAYETGTNQDVITVDQMIDVLKAELKQILVS